MQAHAPVTVICVEGCHGCGKSSVIRELERRGHVIIDERFIESTEVTGGPIAAAQGAVAEVLWAGGWFMSVAKRIRDVTAETGKRPQVIFTDRGPFTAGIYASSGREGILCAVRSMTDDMKLDHEPNRFELNNVVLMLPPDLLWRRIQDRLTKEEWRLKYNEQSREWMTTIIDRYESFLFGRPTPADVRVNADHACTTMIPVSDDTTVDDICAELIALAASKQP